MPAERPIGTYITAPAVVNDWDPRAPAVAVRIASLIRARMPEIEPEHIGSTSVPGCAGKGIIDLMIPFRPDQLQPIKNALEALGFQRQNSPDPWPEDRPMRVGSIGHDGTTFRIHVHVVPSDSPEVDTNRAFPASLRADPALVDAYVAKKREIAGDEGVDSYHYAVTKSEWVSALLEGAEGRGLGATDESEDQEDSATPSPQPSAPSTKFELLDRIELARAEWERLLVLVGEARMEEPLDERGTTIKDIVAHVATYERWTAAMIASGLSGTPATPRELYDEDAPPAGFDTLDLDARNDAILAFYRDRPFAEVLASAEHAFTALVAAVQDVPEEQVIDPAAFEWTGGQSLLELIPEQSYEHYAAHAPAIRILAES